MKAKSAAQKAVSFISRSEPQEPPEREVSALAAHNAAHPEIKQLRDEAVGRFVELFNKLLDGINDVLGGLVLKAETARQAGIYLVEFADTLPGKRITRDFYEQAKDLFRDARGQTIPFETIELLAAHARKQTAPIETIAAALQWKQLLFSVSDETAFKLVSEPVAKKRIPPPDEFGRVSGFIEKPDLEDFVKSWEALKQNPNYFPGGHIRDDLKEMYASEWRPKLEKIRPVFDEIERELGLRVIAV